MCAVLFVGCVVLLVMSVVLYFRFACRCVRVVSLDLCLLFDVVLLLFIVLLFALLSALFCCRVCARLF